MAESKRFLLLRYGGMGDNLFLTPVAKELHRRGYEVDVVTAEHSGAILQNNPFISRLYVAKREGPIRSLPDGKAVNLVDVDGVRIPDIGLYNSYLSTDGNAPWRPYNVCSFLNIIENNTHHPEICSTQMSCFSNTYDNHLMWAGIDPTTVDPEDKRPVYRVTKEERAWAKSVLGEMNGRVVLVQTSSSSLAKIYPPVEIMSWLQYAKGHPVLLWNQTGDRTGHWSLDGVKVALPPHIPSIRCTGALLEHCAFAITADTATSHLAEALGVRHMTYYTFVPAWTISKYYKYEITIDSTAKVDGRVCKCYQITRDCPRIQVEAFKKLSKDEQELLNNFPPHPQERAKLGLGPMVSSVPEGSDPVKFFRCASMDVLKGRLDSAYRHLESLRMEIPYCTASINLIDEVKKHYDFLAGAPSISKEGAEVQS